MKVGAHTSVVETTERAVSRSDPADIASQHCNRPAESGLVKKVSQAVHAAIISCGGLFMMQRVKKSLDLF